MEQDALNRLPSVQLIKEVSLHAKHSQVLMAFVTMYLELLPPHLVLQELVLLIPLLLLMLHAQHGRVVVYGLELQDVKTPLLVQDLMEQMTHAQHFKEVMDHVQEQEQTRQLVFLILQYVTKHLLHSPLMFNAKHGIQFASQMDLDVYHRIQFNAIW